MVELAIPSSDRTDTPSHAAMRDVTTKRGSPWRLPSGHVPSLAEMAIAERDQPSAAAARVPADNTGAVADGAVALVSAPECGGAGCQAGRGRALLTAAMPGSDPPASIPDVRCLLHARMSLVGVFRKQARQGQASEWIQPGQMISELAGQGGQPRPGVVHAGGPGEWMRGALRLAPGSLRWEPDPGVSADPVELATATADPAAGRFQLDLDPVLFEMSQELVAGQAGPAADPGAFWPPAG